MPCLLRNRVIYVCVSRRHPPFPRLDFPEVCPGVNSIGPRQMVTGIFVTLSLFPRRAKRRAGRSFFIHDHQIYMRLISFASAHAIVKSTLSVGRKKRRRTRQRDASGKRGGGKGPLRSRLRMVDYCFIFGSNNYCVAIRLIFSQTSIALNRESRCDILFFFFSFFPLLANARVATAR